MALDWSQCPEVTRSPDVMSGAWVFKDTRLPVATVFDNLNDGMTLEEVYEQFPAATLEQMQAVLIFVCDSLELNAQQRASAKPVAAGPEKIDWSRCTLVARHPEIMSGAWVFDGTRLPAATVFENMLDSMSFEEIAAHYPYISAEQARCG